MNWLKELICGLVGFGCGRSEFSDGVIFEFNIANRDNKNKVPKIVTIADIVDEQQKKGEAYAGHFHINGVRTKVKDLRKFYYDMCKKADPTKRKDIPVYFIYNCSSVYRGWREKYLVGKAWGKSVQQVYRDNPAAQTLYKLASKGLVKHVSAHSNGNVAALSAFHQLAADESSAKLRNRALPNRVRNLPSLLSKINYYGMSMQVNNIFLKPEILKQLGKKTTYFFNLEESYSLILRTIPVQVIIACIKFGWIKEGEFNKKQIDTLSEECKELGTRIGAFKHSGQSIYSIFNLRKFRDEYKSYSCCSRILIPVCGVFLKFSFWLLSLVEDCSIQPLKGCRLLLFGFVEWTWTRGLYLLSNFSLRLSQTILAVLVIYYLVSLGYFILGYLDWIFVQERLPLYQLMEKMHYILFHLPEYMESFIYWLKGLPGVICNFLLQLYCNGNVILVFLVLGAPSIIALFHIIEEHNCRIFCIRAWDKIYNIDEKGERIKKEKARLGGKIWGRYKKSEWPP